jgi:hypothetical protein
MTAEASEQLRLFCNGRLVGLITNAQWLDFPSVAGTFTPVDIDDDLRAVIEWFAAIGDADELTEPPFPPDLLENWWLEYPNGERRHVDVPLIDVNAGRIEWV